VSRCAGLGAGRRPLPATAAATAVPTAKGALRQEKNNATATLPLPLKSNTTISQ